MPFNKPIASLSLDLDNQWSYMKTHGDTGWQSFPSYFQKFVPRMLRFLEERKLRITVFVVGQDAAMPENSESLASIAAAGHEIGNHSFAHEPWMHKHHPDRIDEEVTRAAESIEAATGRRPVGFRGPGYSSSEQMIEVLERRGYLYDASNLPTFLGPLARAYYFKTAKLNPEEMEVRKDLFGGFGRGFDTLRAHRFSGREIIELPVTTMPVFKLPFHISYIIYLSQYSPALGLLYFRTALELCYISGISPSLLLHPPDFLGCDDEIGVDFFPGMRLSSASKLEILSQAIELYSRMFSVVTLQEHASQVAQTLGMVSAPARVARSPLP